MAGRPKNTPSLSDELRRQIEQEHPGAGERTVLEHIAEEMLAVAADRTASDLARLILRDWLVAHEYLKAPKKRKSRKGG